MKDGWLNPKSPPALKPGEVHVWLAHLPEALPQIEELTTVLSPEETERAQQFRNTTQGQHWQLTRAILRRLAAHYAQANARDLGFVLGPHGKPALARPGDSGLHFNTSHSGEYAVFAFTHAGEVGVDIEQLRKEMPRRDDVARRYFAPGEWKQLEAMPEPERGRAFFDCWTRKEAFVKARGEGVFSGLDQFEVALAEPRLVRLTGGNPQEWSMAALPAVAGHTGAVVVRGTGCDFRALRWSCA